MTSAKLDAVERRLDAIDQSLRALQAGAGAAAETIALREALAAVEKQIGRSGREQFKANTLAEAQATRIDAALEALRAADARREAELAALREQSRAAQAGARLDVIRAVLPTLDGLDEALRAGQNLLATPEPTQAAEDERWSMVDWLFGRAAPHPSYDNGTREQPAALREALDAWLVGLTFIRRRLLDVLAAEDVRPMDAEGQPFDPQRHIAIEVVPAQADLPPGTVASELRRGYLVGNRVLRHAEVAVAREAEERGSGTDTKLYSSV
jgi:molecular chaperone GrpE